MDYWGNALMFSKYAPTTMPSGKPMITSPVLSNDTKEHTALQKIFAQQVDPKFRRKEIIQSAIVKIIRIKNEIKRTLFLGQL